MAHSDAGHLPPDLAAAFDAARERSRAVPLDLHWHASVSSTMDLAAAAAQAGAPEGLVIIADEQTAGRGRRGRAWSSPPGTGLYVTFLFRPPAESIPLHQLSLMTLTAGVSVRAAIERVTGLAADLKWPNDVVVGPRKLAGILAEGLSIGTPAQTVTIGVGINLRDAAMPPDLAARATSLEQEVGRPVDREQLIEELLVMLPADYRRLLGAGADDILRTWRASAPSAFGSQVEWEREGEWRRGTTAGVDNRGALLIRTATGLERVTSGEVRWL